jgi:inosine-uridine nucleoside N-ribohydrolase
LPPDPERIDWNLIVDPVAAEIVYQTPVPLHRSVGLDVTERLIIPAAEVRQRFTAPLLRPVLDFGEIWFEQFVPYIVFHDPLAAATVFAPELCQYEQGWVTVDRAGATRITAFTPGGPSAPHQVAVAVDQQRYFHHFFSVFDANETDDAMAGHSPAR